MHKQKATLTLDFSVSTQNLLVFKIGSVINTKINHSFSQFKGGGGGLITGSQGVFCYQTNGPISRGV